MPTEHTPAGYGWKFSVSLRSRHKGWACSDGSSRSLAHATQQSMLIRWHVDNGTNGACKAANPTATALLPEYRESSTPTTTGEMRPAANPTNNLLASGGDRSIDKEGGLFYIRDRMTRLTCLALLRSCWSSNPTYSLMTLEGSRSSRSERCDSHSRLDG